MLALLGSPEKVRLFEKRMREHLGIPNVLGCVGQVYPRSLDFEVLSVLKQLSSGPINFANMIRLMAGHELAVEGFGKGGLRKNRCVVSRVRTSEKAR
jgi:adenylosuccinate lyase